MADKSKANWSSFLADAQRLKVFLNGSPTSGLEIARAQLELKRPEAALVDTLRFVAMGQTNGILDSPLFQPVRKAIDTQMQANLTAISVAKPIFRLPDARLLPEDVDYDPRSDRFFMTSILQHKIVALDEKGHQTIFAESPDHWPMLAIKVDAKRRRLWATEVALDGFTSVAVSDWGKSVLLEFDLDHGRLLSRHAGPPHSSLGDMTLAPNGDPIISDGTGGGIYRMRDHALRRIDHGDFISPQTIAVCPDGQHVFVPDYVRGIAAFDLETGATNWFSMGDRYALNGIDGLYCRGSSLIAVQNGTSPVRVIAFILDTSRSAIIAETIIERATGTLGEPTHGVFVGNSFFYIANSGWDALDAHGVEVSKAHLTSGLMMRFDGFVALGGPLGAQNSRPNPIISSDARLTVDSRPHSR